MSNLIISIIILIILIFFILKELKKNNIVNNKNNNNNNNNLQYIYIYIVNYCIILFAFTVTIYLLFLLKINIKEYISSKDSYYITISAEGVSDKNKYSNEVVINSVIVDNKVYFPSQLVQSGFWECSDEGALNYRDYDTTKELTKEITLSIPKGISQTIVFQKNKYRGKVAIKNADNSSILDLYSEADINKGYKKIQENDLELFKIDRSTISYNSYFYIYFIVVIILFMYYLFLVTKNRKQYKISEVRNIVIILLFALFTCLTFTNSPWIKMNFWGDSDFFSLLGKLLYQNHYILYRDVCDIKGPFFYILEYLGYVITNDYTGMWLLEYINTALFLIVSYKISKKFLDKNLALASVILANLELSYYLRNGNTNETFTLTMFMFALYIFIKCIEGEYIESKYVIIIGAFFTLSSLIKLPYLIFYLPFLFVIILIYCRNKKYSILLKWILAFLFGLVITVLPFIIYFMLNNALEDAINCIYYYNISYTKFDPNNSFLNFIFLKENPSIIYISSIGIYIISALLLKKRILRVSLIVTNTITFILSIIVCGLSGSYFDHYYIIVYPTLLLGSIIIVSFIKNLDTNSKQLKLYCCILSLILLFICFDQNSIFYYNYSRKYVFNSINNKIRVSYYINRFTKEDDKIITYASDSSIYLYSGRLPASRHPVPSFLAYNEEMRNDLYNDLNNTYREQKLGAIVLRDDTFNIDKRFYDFFTNISSSYECIYNNDNIKLYIIKRAVYN